MRYWERYIAFGLFLAAAVILKFSIFSTEYGEVKNFRGADLDSRIWNPLIAASVNENLLSVVIDNREYTNEDTDFYMDDNLDIMIPVTMLRDALNCSVRVYEGEQLLIEKYTSEWLFSMDLNRTEGDQKDGGRTLPFAKKDGDYYVSLNAISEYLDYSYSWNIQENIAMTTDTSGRTSILPSRYDLREKKRAAGVRNQGAFGTCWAFAALGALESSLLPGTELIYSPDHMTLNNGFNLTQDEGGEYTMGMAYLAAWRGPVYEEDDPYGDGQTDDTLEAVKHVQEMQVIDGKDYEKIKEAVFKYGGVQTSIFNALRSSQSYSPYYNKQTNSYCYIGTEKPNHDVVIIGWDDNYQKENFSMDLEGDGAFICQNSWGNGFGEDGVFYISYYDTNIGTHNVVYTRVEETDNYDNIYQSDLCGWVGQLGYNKDSIYGANVFTAKGDEELIAAGFYATGKDTQYELYVVRNFENEKSLSQMVPVASGKLGNMGYYTVDFDHGVHVGEGERYAVVLHIITPNSIHPMAIEYIADEATKYVDLSDGESYISPNGRNWVSVDSVEESNLCIKAFSNNR